MAPTPAERLVVQCATLDQFARMEELIAAREMEAVARSRTRLCFSFRVLRAQNIAAVNATGAAIVRQPREQSFWSDPIVPPGCKILGRHAPRL
jgi:hypothetical protein